MKKTRSTRPNAIRTLHDRIYGKKKDERGYLLLVFTFLGIAFGIIEGMLVYILMIIAIKNC
jgi:hypothetical protein